MPAQKRAISQVNGESEDANKKAKSQSNSLTDFRICEETRAALEKSGVTSLFPIQVATFDHIYDGFDLIGKSRTGTGKTLSFVLPVVEKLKGKFTGKEPVVLVMTPTRELAKQVATVFEIVPNIKTVCVYGGTPYGPQQEALRLGVHVVVGTPGRIIDLINRKNLKLHALKVVVLDEADQMLDQGFGENMDEILTAAKTQKEAISAERAQILLFSATVPTWVHDAVKKYMKADKKLVDLVGKQVQSGNGIRHIAISCHWEQMYSVLGDVVLVYSGAHGRTIVFAGTKKQCNEVALSEHIKQECQSIHGDIPQEQREVTMEAFRSGKFKCLVATDVAARGLDIPMVELVVQVGIPKDGDQYIHRSGRTARAGKTGTCVVLYTPKEAGLLDMIEKRTGAIFERIGPPQPKDIIAACTQDGLKALDLVQPEVLPLFKETAEQLIAERGAVEALSAALAYLSGQHTGIKHRSLMGSNAGQTTLILAFNYQVRTTGFVWNIINRYIPQLEPLIKDVKLTADCQSAVLNIAHDKVEEALAGFKDKPGVKLEVAKTLPDIRPAPNQQGNTGGRGWGNNWGRGGGQARGRGFTQSRSASAGRGRGGDSGRGRGRGR